MTRRMDGRLGLSLALLAVMGCASSQPATEVAPAEAAPAEETGYEDLSAEEAEALAAIEADAAMLDEEAPQQDAVGSGKDAPRDVTYRVSTEGLRVEVEGAEFAPEVEAARFGGGWGVKLSVEATTTKDAVLFWPNRGPLAFGGKVVRANGTTEKFGDRREGGEVHPLTADSPAKFSRTWPDDDLKPLASGDTLELHVGLWGFGPSEDNRRPVKKFVVVTAKAGPGGIQPLMQPPPQ